MMKLNNKGDTIIEVLIAIAVVTTVLGGAYASSNRSLNTTVAVRERDQGTRLVETQVEQLKAAMGDPVKGKAIVDAAVRFFCMNNVNRIGFSSGSPDLSSPASYPPECVVDSNNQSGGTASTPYYVSIERNGSDDNQFTIRGSWDKVGGGPREEVFVVYRVYPAQVVLHDLLQLALGQVRPKV